MDCANCENKKCNISGFNCTEYNYEDLLPISDNFRIASEIESNKYKNLCRLEEIILFCEKKGYRKIGIAFSIELSYEAGILDDILRRRGFEVKSVCCKIGGVSKDELSIPKTKSDRFEAICNPYLQAKVLNDWEADFNINMGLCIGHDIDFSEYSIAPTSTFIVNDKLLAHNPAIALYSNFYRRKVNVLKKENFVNY